MAFSNDDILVLAKAGFNAKQIAALNMIGTTPVAQTPEPQPNPTPTPEPQKTPATTQAPEPKTQPAPTPTPEPQPTPQGASIDDVLKAVAGISDAIKIGNLQNLTQPKPVTSEDILAEIINPPTKEDKK